MSIAVALQRLQANGSLQAYVPPNTTKAARRRLFLTQEAMTELNKPDSAVNSQCGRAYVLGALSRWVLGELVHGDRSGGRFLKRLTPPPPEIWEIRVTEPVVQGRLFGRFAEPDTFILMRMHTRKLLGKKGSPDWNAAMSKCERRWNELFPNAAPFAGSSIAHYVTENCDDYPLEHRPARRPRSR